MCCELIYSWGTCICIQVGISKVNGNMANTRLIKPFKVAVNFDKVNVVGISMLQPKFKLNQHLNKLHYVTSSLASYTDSVFRYPVPPPRLILLNAFNTI